MINFFKRCKAPIALCFLFGMYAGGLHAGIDCQYDKVIAIQAQSSNVLIRVSDGTNHVWKSLGQYSSASFQSFQSLAQQALATDMRITLRFPEGYDCSSHDYTTRPSVVRIYK